VRELNHVRGATREHGANTKKGAAIVAPASMARRTLALQRLAGNRATGRLLARWTNHPDPEKKGVMVPDIVAADLTRFNPPTNS